MVESTTYAKRLVKGSTIIFVAAIIAGLIGLLLRAFLARTFIANDMALGVTEGSHYGLFYAVVSIISFFELFRGLGLDTTLVRHVPEFEVKKQFGKIKSSIYFVSLIQVVSGVLFAAVFFIFSDQMSAVIVKDVGIPAATVVPIIRILAVWFVVMGFFTLTKVFQGFQNMSMYAVVTFLDNMTLLLLSFLFVGWLSLSIMGVAYAYMITAVIIAVLSFAILRRKYPHVFKAKYDSSEQLKKQLVKFAAPIFMAGLVGLVFGFADTIMLAVFRTPAEVGYYQIALPMSAFLISVAASVMAVFFPMVSELWARRKYALLGDMLHFLTKFAFLIVTPLVLVFIAFPDIIINVLFGQAYLPAVIALQILGLSTIPLVMYRILSLTVVGIGKPVINTTVAALMAGFNFVANLILIPRYGIEGAAFTALGTCIVGSVVLFYYAEKFIKFKVPVLSIAKAMIGGMLMLIFIYGLKSILVLSTLYEVLIIGAASFIIYTVWILATRAVTREDMVLVARVIPIPKKLLGVVSKFIRS
jgi:O-antigen/teichoic acid export membrane protein